MGRGDSGIVLPARGLLIPSHSFDLALLIPGLPDVLSLLSPGLLPDDPSSLGLDAARSVPSLLQSRPRTSRTAWRTAASTASDSHASEASPSSLAAASTLLRTPTHRMLGLKPTSGPCCPSTPSRPPALLSRLAALLRWSALPASLSMARPLSCQPRPNTSGALSSTISTAATTAPMSVWCRTLQAAESGGRTSSGARRWTNRLLYRDVPHMSRRRERATRASPEGLSRVVTRSGPRAAMTSDAVRPVPPLNRSRSRWLEPAPAGSFLPSLPALCARMSNSAVPAETMPS